MKPKVLIFGGGGFIGAAIAERLLVGGHPLRIFERPRVEPHRQFTQNERVEWVRGDILNGHDVRAALEGVDVVMQLVSTTLPKNSNDDPIYDVQTNLVGTLQILNAMIELNIRRIVFISSGGTVYGPPIRIPIDEGHPTEPSVSYGIVKLSIEKYLLLYERLHGVNATILRVANPYGERQRIETAQGAVAVFLHRALQGKPVEIWGDGGVIRDYIHVDDVAEAFTRAVAYMGPYKVFNVGSGVGTSLNELCELLEAAIGSKIERRHLPGRPFDVPVNVLDNGLARRELGWTPVVSLREGLVRTADWMRRELAE